MKKSKVIFLIVLVVFFMTMAFFSYDVSKKTTFPGAKKLPSDSLMSNDTLPSK